MAVDVSMKLFGDVDYLRLVWQAVEGVLESVSFPEDEEQTRYNILLGVQEALTNIIKHGYGGEPAPIYLGLRQDGEQFVIELQDEAEAFDPTQVGAGPDTEDASMLPEGGYGIQIIRAVMDGVEYRREGGRNYLTLSKVLVPVATRI
jgi:anti-sigma regulatory factor (Ser/Thr protein kinase)